jgi:hypothetical protein
MNQELQELEDRLTATMKTGFAEAATNIKAVEGRLNDNIEAVEGRLNGSIEAVEGRLSGSIEAVEGRLNGSIEAVEGRLNGSIEAVEGRLSDNIEAVEGRLNGSIAAVNQRVGVLHEATMAQFKVSLEAIHGTSEILSKHIDKRTDAIQSDLALVKKAVKANQAESLADRARRG